MHFDLLVFVIFFVSTCSGMSRAMPCRAVTDGAVLGIDSGILSGSVPSQDFPVPCRAIRCGAMEETPLVFKGTLASLPP